MIKKNNGKSAFIHMSFRNLIFATPKSKEYPTSRADLLLELGRSPQSMGRVVLWLHILAVLSAI
jgi:hypothetical protein